MKYISYLVLVVGLMTASMQYGRGEFSYAILDVFLAVFVGGGGVWLSRRILDE